MLWRCDRGLRAGLHDRLRARLHELLRTSHDRMVSWVLPRSHSHANVGLAERIRRGRPDNVRGQLRTGLRGELCTGLQRELRTVVRYKLCTEYLRVLSERLRS